MSKLCSDHRHFGEFKKMTICRTQKKLYEVIKPLKNIYYCQFILFKLCTTLKKIIS